MKEKTILERLDLIEKYISELQRNLAILFEHISRQRDINREFCKSVELHTREDLT